MGKNEKRIIRRRLVRSYAASTVSISLVLMLTGLAALFWTAAGGVARYFRENVAVSVVLDPTLEEQEARAFCASLAASEQVKEVEFVTREEGEAELRTMLGEDFLSVFEAAPIPFSIDVHLDAAAVTPSALEHFREVLEADSRVQEVVYRKSLVEALNANLRKLSLVLGVTVLLLMLISFALIGNTVRLNLHARRFTVHTMRQVGARNSFIRRPFVRQALLQGLVSGLLAAGILRMRSRGSLLYSMLDEPSWPWVTAALIPLGMALCALSAARVVTRLLRSRKDDLYY